MKKPKTWSYAPYKPLFFNTGDIYVCRVVPHEKSIHFEGQIAQIMDIAIKECERMYPVFNVVMTKGMEPTQALYPMMMETVGQA